MDSQFFCYSSAMRHAISLLITTSHKYLYLIIVYALVMSAAYCVIPAHSHTLPDTHQPHASQLTHTHDHIAEVVLWLSMSGVLLFLLGRYARVLAQVCLLEYENIPPLKPPPQYMV